MITISQVLERAVPALRKVSDTPRLDAQTLLAHHLGKSRTWLLAHPEENLTDPVFASFQQELNDLEKGTPLPYVLGSWEFYGLNFAVTPDTLIPRPETELLVDQALGWLKLKKEPCLAVDIGTGTGCIAIALVRNIPYVTVIAADISYPALKIARKNAIRHEVIDRLRLIQADLFPPISSRFDLICANLPYIPTQTLENLDISGREPNQALDGGRNGLDFIRRLILEAKTYIAPGGILFVEIESSQGEKLQDLTEEAFPHAEIEVLPDLSGRDRLLAIQPPDRK